MSDDTHHLTAHGRIDQLEKRLDILTIAFVVLLGISILWVKKHASSSN